MFDPSRGARHAAPGAMDLGDSGAPVVDPYTYGDNDGQHEMSQYAAGSNNYPSIPSGPSHVGGEDLAAVGLAGVGAGAAGAAAGGAPRRGPSSASTLTSAGYAGRGAGNYNPEGFDAYGTPLPMPVPMPGGSSGSSQQQSNNQTPSSAATRKMQEAQRERLRSEGTSGGVTSPTATSHTGTGSDVMVHSDGGRYIPDEDVGAQLQPEVPPTYDSIPADR